MSATQNPSLVWMYARFPKQSYMLAPSFLVVFRAPPCHHQAGLLPLVSSALHNVFPTLTPEKTPSYPVVYDRGDIRIPPVHVLNVRCLTQPTRISVSPDTLHASTLEHLKRELHGDIDTVLPRNLSDLPLLRICQNLSSHVLAPSFLPGSRLTTNLLPAPT